MLIGEKHSLFCFFFFSPVLFSIIFHFHFFFWEGGDGVYNFGEDGEKQWIAFGCSSLYCLCLSLQSCPLI